MPLHNVDIFEDLPSRLDKTVNPYVNLLVGGQHDSLPLCYGQSLKGKAGRWRETLCEKMGFPPEKLILEIGVHKGKVIINLALDYPQWGFLGMDITFKRVVLSAEKLTRAHTKNAMILLGNARHISKVFTPGELDGAIIFFPDPWVKKKSQMRNRLLNESFCRDLSSSLKQGAFFWLKTDSEDYFRLAETMVTGLGFKPSARLFPQPYESTFEARFRSFMLPTFEEFWTKC
ncbi:MAG: hypothetical protein HYW48_01680 [Deltaproteobacteria bacterium]|nr:hypothetical protein [Deltaproteobacteria bacterium]